MTPLPENTAIAVPMTASVICFTSFKYQPTNKPNKIPSPETPLTTTQSIRAPLQRQIVVLARRHIHLLALEHGERARDAAARRVRHDDVVDIAALGGDEGRQKAVLIFLGARGDLVLVADVGAKDDFDRALGAHHGNLRGRPGVIEIATDVLRRH